MIESTQKRPATRIYIMFGWLDVLSARRDFRQNAKRRAAKSKNRGKESAKMKANIQSCRSFTRAKQSFVEMKIVWRRERWFFRKAERPLQPCQTFPLASFIFILDDVYFEIALLFDFLPHRPRRKRRKKRNKKRKCPDAFPNPAGTWKADTRT